MTAAAPIMCPSAQPGMREPRLLGVVAHGSGAPVIAYLNEEVPVTAELLAQAAPADPNQVFRIAAHCEEARCKHFDGRDCNLAQRIVQILPAVVDVLPACLIRGSCRWFVQEGKAACYRCPQVVTQPLDPSPEYERAVFPG